MDTWASDVVLDRVATATRRLGISACASLQKWWALQQQERIRMAGLLQKEPKNAFTPGLPSSRAQLFTARVRHSVPEQSISPGAERTVKKN